MSRWLVRFGYDGAGFAGWARQPGLRTVEGILREGVLRTGVAPTVEAAGLAVASRTDRGVSARRNALVLRSALPPAGVLRALNGIAPDIFFTALVEVPDDFSVRSPTCRWYRYFEAAEGRHLERWQRAARHLRGNLDVRSFGRDLPRDRPAMRTIESVEVRRSAGGWLVVDFRAPSFVWGMVRKLIAALRKVDEGTLSIARLDASVRGEQRLTLPLAEPEGLVLWEVTYPLRWSHEWSGPNRGQTRYLTGEARRARLRGLINSVLSRGSATTDRVRRQ